VLAATHDWRGRYRQLLSSYDWSRAHARRRGGEAWTTGAATHAHQPDAALEGTSLMQPALELVVAAWLAASTE